MRSHVRVGVEGLSGFMRACCLFACLFSCRILFSECAFSLFLLKFCSFVHFVSFRLCGLILFLLCLRGTFVLCLILIQDGWPTIVPCMGDLRCRMKVFLSLEYTFFELWVLHCVRDSAPDGLAVSE